MTSANQKRSRQTEDAQSRRLQRVVRPTREMKLKALSDIRAWTTEHSAPMYSDMVEERAESREEREQWRRAYDWVDDILVRAIKRIKLV